MKRKNANKNPKLQNIPKAHKKPPQKTPTDKRWFIAAAVALVAVVALTFALIRYYSDPMDAVVARFNGQRITARDVSMEMNTARNQMSRYYQAMFPEALVIEWDREISEGLAFARANRESAALLAELGWDRDVPDGLTFEQAVREDAVRAVARNILMSEYASERGVIFAGHEVLTQKADMIGRNIIDDPTELAAFEPYMLEDDAPAAEALASALLERALAGEDFRTLVETYGEDPGMWSNPEGYTFVAGVMVEEFYEATKALEIGEISGLVRSDFGIHIIMRVEPNPEDTSMTGGQEFPLEELLGAQHILIPITPFNQRLNDAIPAAFESQLDDTNLRLRRALNDVPLV